VDVAKDRRRRTPALLLVDMINLFDFPDGAAMATAARRITPALVRLRARFDRAGAPVIHVNDNFAQWRGEFRDLVASCVEAGGIPAEIATRLAPQPQHYHVLKPKHSAFASSALPVLLAKLGVRRLVITGIAADSCVLATAQDANMAEYGDLGAQRLRGLAPAAAQARGAVAAFAFAQRAHRGQQPRARAVPAIAPTR